jgi:hypothetical protein
MHPPFVADFVLQFLDELGHVRISPRQHVASQRAARRAEF